MQSLTNTITLRRHHPRHRPARVHSAHSIAIEKKFSLEDVHHGDYDQHFQQNSHPLNCGNTCCPNSVLQAPFLLALLRPCHSFHGHLHTTSTRRRILTDTTYIANLQPYLPRCKSERGRPASEIPCSTPTPTLVIPLAPHRDGWTPLHAASQEGHDDIVRLLLDYGAAPNHQDNRGRTPLHVTWKMTNNHRTSPYLLLRPDVGANYPCSYG